LKNLINGQVNSAPDNHLKNLNTSDEHADGRWDLNLECLEREVRVHPGVYDEVDAAEESPRGTLLRVAVPGVDQNGDVVVPVKED